MNLNPIKVSETLDKFASYIEQAKELTPEERMHFALRLDQINDEFEKAAAEEGLRTKNGTWLMGDKDEWYMKRYDETGVVDNFSDEDEKRYMDDFTNTVQREAPSVSERKEPPTRDLDTTVKQPGGAWTSPKLDKSLPEGNIEYGQFGKKSHIIPKRKLD